MGTSGYLKRWKGSIGRFYCSTQAEKPLVDKLLTFQRPPASMNTWSLKEWLDKWTKNTAPRKQRKFPVLHLASWNIKTLSPGFTEDLLMVDKNRKTTIINSRGSILILLQWRKQDFLQIAISKKTTPHFGREENWRSNISMELDWSEELTTLPRRIT